MAVTRDGVVGEAIVATLVVASLLVSVYHVLAHTAPLLPTLLGQGLLLTVSVAFAAAAYLVLTGVQSPRERDVVGHRTGAAYGLAAVATAAYAVHQFLTPEANVAVDVVLFQTTFVATAGGIAGLAIGREAARNRRTIAALRETTEELDRSRQRAEAEKRRFESLFENAPTMIVDVRREGDALCVEDANAAFAAVAADAEAVAGEDLLESVSHRGPSVRDRLLEALAADDRYEGEVTIDERGEKHYKLRLVPYDAGDDTAAAFIIYTDVTELRQAKRGLEDRYEAVDAALQRRNTQLERSTEHLNQFAYVASHDLQEPLRMVASYLDLLADEYEDELDEEADQYIAYAVDGAERMQSMVEGLLEFSRVSTGAMEYAEVDTERVLNGVREALRPRIEEADATVTLGDLPVVEADEDRIATLFEHLLENAIQHGGTGADPPTVEVGATEESDGYVFRVADDGPGIPGDQQEQVFEIFEQRDRGTEGAGIGLAVCQRIVDRHGGDLWVESDEGSGAAFHVSIPKADAARPEPGTTAAEVDRL